MIPTENENLEGDLESSGKKLIFENAAAAGHLLKKKKKERNRRIQKKRVKAAYAEAYRKARKTGSTAGKVEKTVTTAGSRIEIFVQNLFEKNKGKIAIIGGVAMLVILIASCLSSCAAVFSEGDSGVMHTSYLGTDNNILAVNKDYKDLEKALQKKIAETKTLFPGYDEYRFDTDAIGHDPYALTSYLTAKYGGYTRDEVQSDLKELFDEQYKLTYETISETRYRTETRTDRVKVTDPDTGLVHEEDYTHDVQVPYEWHILKVTLRNKGMEAVVTPKMNDSQLNYYSVYQSDSGNRSYLFGGENAPYNLEAENENGGYNNPGAALSDGSFKSMILEAEKYLGYPYVWGGASPSTSFDCSGFVCWVINHSGVGSVGRTTAEGLRHDCTIVSSNEARPGDLIFFQGTYATQGASHVGIYVGDGMMIHCGNPIKYSSIDTSYWQKHFYCFGRIKN